MLMQEVKKIIDTGYSYCFKSEGEDIEISYCDPKAEQVRERITQLIQGER